MTTRVCKICNLEQDIEYFEPHYKNGQKQEKRRKVCNKCKGKIEREQIRNNPERHKKAKAYLNAYYKEHKEISKVKSYRTADRRKGRNSITLEEYRKLITSHPFCFYCGENNQYVLGLDRRDNNKGHEIGNVDVCCEKCNHFLTDIPYEAKLLLKEGLKKIKEQDLFKNWIIKTKRHKI